MKNRQLDALTHKRQSRMAVAMGLALGLGASVTLAAPSPTVDRNNLDPVQVLVRGQNSGDGLLPTVAHGPVIDTQPVRAAAAIIVVTNCNDSGSGSLRAAVASASSGDTVDISGLDCSINLNSSIVTSVDDLTIKDDPTGKYGIYGRDEFRPLTHLGTGTLTLDGLIVSHGRISLDSDINAHTDGGCIYSTGNVNLINQSAVMYCMAMDNNASVHGGGISAIGNVTVTASTVVGNMAFSRWTNALGGGIYAGGRVTLKNSTVRGNSTYAAFNSRGGGIYAGNGFFSKYSRVGGNSAAINSSGGGSSSAGGVWVKAGATSMIERSTFYENSADRSGAMMLGGAGGVAPVAGSTSILHTTIANNRSLSTTQGSSGALQVRQPTTIANSTISGNLEQNASDKKYGAGIHVARGTSLTLSSTVVSGNYLLTSANEEKPTDMGSNDVDTPVPVSGSHNLVSLPANVSLPSGTITLYGANLGPLQDNGGPTPTMLPRGDSMLLDAGLDNDDFIDQRGSGFARVIGTAADIGATEFDPAVDIIFIDGFD